MNYVPGHIWKYIFGQMLATTHDLGPQKVTFGKGNSFIWRTSRLVKYSSIWPPQRENKIVIKQYTYILYIYTYLYTWIRTDLISSGRSKTRRLLSTIWGFCQKLQELPGQERRGTLAHQYGGARWVETTWGSRLVGWWFPVAGVKKKHETRIPYLRWDNSEICASMWLDGGNSHFF